MKIALIVSLLVTSLALNAQTLQAIQGKDVHISDSVRGIINYLRENDEVALKDLTKDELFVNYDIDSLLKIASSSCKKSSPV